VAGYGEPREISTANEISGSVAGPVVQAAVVHGDIHLHGLHDAGGGRGTGSGSAALPTPRQLPAGPPVLVAREREVESVGGLAGAGSGLVVLTGPAGVGKAAVALTWLQRESAARFPDGQLYADLRSYDSGSPVQPLTVLRGFLAALGVPAESVPTDLAGSAALFRSATAGRRMAVMLHGATSAAQVRPLIPGGGSCVTLITSTWRLGGLGMDGARWLTIAPLGESAAVSLLSALAGAERVADEAQAAREVVSLCGGLPLALCMVGNRLAFNPYQRLGRLAAELRDERRRLDRLTEDSESGGVRDIIDACYRGLPADAAFLYRVLGALPLGRFSVAPAAAGVGLAEEDVSGLLRVLVEASLLQQVGEDSYQFHELVRLHSRDLTRGGDGVADGEEAVVRVERWYLATAIAAATAVRPYRRDRGPEPEPGGEAVQGAMAEASAAGRSEATGRSEAAGLSGPPMAFETQRAALDWLDVEAPQLLGVARHAAEHGRPRTALGIALQMWSLFAHRKYYRIWQEFDLLGLRCARQVGDPAAEARMLRRLGMLANDLGRYDEAAGHFGAAAALYERLGDRHRQATVINSLGVVAIRRGDLETAIGLLNQALAMHEALGDVRQCALVRVDLGNALIQVGRPGDALEQLRLAEEHLRQSPDLSSGARLRMLKGRARGHLGDMAAAEDELDSALESMRALSSVSGQAEALGYRGELAERSGVPTEAELYYEQASELLDRLGTPSSGWLRERIGGLSPLAGRVVSGGPDPSGRL
jgi:tetratricopeptide (TPR) repeat protein